MYKNWNFKADEEILLYSFLFVFKPYGQFPGVISYGIT